MGLLGCNGGIPMKHAWTLLLPLAACTPSPNDRICTTPTELPAVGDWAGCVHRWSYRLAKTEGPVSVIAKSVVGGCADAIAAADDQAANDAMAGETEKPKPLADKALGLALFHVAQARAGHCAIP
ncbi:MAG: hypothetical protein B7Y43_03570 [Sphingomonas sp. 28-62-20]|nr:MAG: hypothetical protein B7Y43_03570 [Sphingomonas sp. 28-62-20]